MDETPKIEWSKSDDFKYDLDHLLSVLEKLCNGKEDHVNYISAYKYFLYEWSPKN